MARSVAFVLPFALVALGKSDDSVAKEALAVHGGPALFLERLDDSWGLPVVFQQAKTLAYTAAMSGQRLSGLGPQEREMLEAVSQMIVGISLPGVNESHHNDQAELDRAAASLASCDDRRLEVEEADPAEASLHAAREELRACRLAESPLETNKTAVCTLLQEFVSDMPPPPAVLPPQGSPGSAVEEYLRVNHAWFSEMLPRYQLHEAECTEATAVHGLRRGECGQLQGAFESVSCEAGSIEAVACQVQASCVHAQAQSLNETVQRATRTEASRKAEYFALRRIQCYMEALPLDDGQERSQLLQSCEDPTHPRYSSGFLDLRFPGAQLVPCVASSLGLPCDVDFVAREYLPPALPANTPPHDCMPCGSGEVAGGSQASTPPPNADTVPEAAAEQEAQEAIAEAVAAAAAAIAPAALPIPPAVEQADEAIAEAIATAAASAATHPSNESLSAAVEVTTR